jgi:amidase
MSGATMPTAHDAVQPGTSGALLREAYGQAPASLGEACHGALTGQRLVVKDVFDIEGLRTGCGSPLWLQQQAPSRQTAVAVRLLHEAGCSWVGKALTDELTYSLAGINAHYGTPLNPCSPARLPGGSSSGSAVAVAAGLADVGLGTDCGGSIRVPASYGGLWGLRPTHGRIATNGCFTLAHSFDTVGALTRTGALLARVFETLAHSQVAPCEELPRLCVPADLGGLLDAPLAAQFNGCAERLGAEPVPLTLQHTLDWADAFRTLQAAEVWQQHGAWYRRHGASMGADIGQRFVRAGQIGAAAVAQAQRTRVAASAQLGRWLDAGALLLVPTLPTPAPLLSDTPAQVDAARMRAQQLLCWAGLAGLPQIAMPWTTVEGGAVGLSLIGPRGADERVLAAALRLEGLLATPR